MEEQQPASSTSSAARLASGSSEIFFVDVMDASGELELIPVKLT